MILSTIQVKYKKINFFNIKIFNYNLNFMIIHLYSILACSNEFIMTISNIHNCALITLVLIIQIYSYLLFIKLKITHFILS